MDNMAHGYHQCAPEPVTKEQAFAIVEQTPNILSGQWLNNVAFPKCMYVLCKIKPILVPGGKHRNARKPLIPSCLFS